MRIRDAGAHDAAMRRLVLPLLLLSVPAMAQDGIPMLPPVPAGMPPLLTWALSLLTVVLTVTLPVAVAFLKQRFDVANTVDHHTLVDHAIQHAALLSYGEQVGGAPPAAAAAAGLAYVKLAAAPSIAAVKVTDIHLDKAIAAEVVSLNKTTTMPVPIVPVDSVAAAPPVPPISSMFSRQKP